MTTQRLTVLGGSRSGKSFFAERALSGTGQEPLTYLATAEAGDDEMRSRIARHASRRGDRWRLIEEPLDVAGRLAGLDPRSSVLIDCATLWLSNHLLAGSDIATETDRLTDAIDRFHGTLAIVTNEVGHGIVPDNALSRRFRDAQGVLNQRLAHHSDVVVLVIAGLPLVLKGRLPAGMAA